MHSHSERQNKLLALVRSQRFQFFALHQYAFRDKLALELVNLALAYLNLQNSFASPSSSINEA